MNKITSSQNPLIKEIKSLKNRKYREEKQQFFIEGLRFVEEALKVKAEILRIFVSEEFYETKSSMLNSMIHPYEVIALPEKLFTEISDTETPQGILAVLKMKSYNLEEIVKEDNLLLVLDTIQDPGNMGTLIRTADAAAFTGIVISRGCVDLYNPKVLRSTMGSLFHIPISFTGSTTEAVEMLKTKGVKVYAAHLKGTRNYFEMDMRSNIAFIIGNEAKGISDEAAAVADLLVRIPMPGRAESLNASVAGSLLMYECVRQKMSR